MKRLSRRRSRRGQAEDSYWISFSDLMSALLLVFILAVVVLVLQLMEKQETLTAQEERMREQQELFAAQIGTLREAEIVRAEMLREIQERLAAQGIAVKVTGNNSVLSIPTEQLGFS